MRQKENAYTKLVSKQSIFCGQTIAPHDSHFVNETDLVLVEKEYFACGFEEIIAWRKLLLIFVVRKNEFCVIGINYTYFLINCVGQKLFCPFSTQFRLLRVPALVISESSLFRHFHFGRIGIVRLAKPNRHFS